MTIAYQPNSNVFAGVAKTKANFNLKFKVEEAYLNLLRKSTDGFIPGETYTVPDLPSLTIQPLFAVRSQNGETPKFIVGLRINNLTTSKTTLIPMQMDYNVEFKTANFTKNYKTTTVPINPAGDVEVFDALVMKVFNFNETFDPKNNYICKNEICVDISGSIFA